MGSTDNAIGHGRGKIGGEEEGIPHGEHGIANTQLVAVAQSGDREIIASEQFDEGDIACGIDANDDGIVEVSRSRATA